MNDPNIAIDVNYVSKRYKNILALDSIDLTVNRGDVFGLLGPNGAGKTTLVKLLIGFSNPDSGEINLFGDRVGVRSRQKIGFLPEKIYIHPYLTAIEFIEYSVKLCGQNMNYHKYQEILEKVGLKDNFQQKIGTFSKGMMQRLGIAQAIIHGPELLILDEPGTGLDPLGLVEVRNLLIEENRKKGTTIFINTHRLLEVEQLCTKIAILNKGKLIAKGSMSELTQTKDSIKIVLKEPTESILNFLHNISTEIRIDGNSIVFCPKFDIDTIRLPILLIENGCHLLKYEVLQENLEEIFIRLIKGEKP